MAQAYISLAQECVFAGRHLEGIGYGQQAVALLERPEKHSWLGQAWYTLGMLYTCHGDFCAALDAVSQCASIGEMLADRRLQTNAAHVMGWVYAEQDLWAEGIEACHHALACAPDSYEAAVVTGVLGYAYLKKGDIPTAIRVLEDARHQASQYRSRQVQSWFAVFLIEAYLADGQIVRAHELALQGFAMSRDIGFPMGIGLTQRVLGRIAHARGNLPEAENCLQAALTIFAAIEAQHELARTQFDLASLAHTQGNQGTATTHLSTAYAGFKKLQILKWAERTEQLAQEYGVALTEVELEAFETEGEA